MEFPEFSFNKRLLFEREKFLTAYGRKSRTFLKKLINTPPPVKFVRQCKLKRYRFSVAAYFLIFFSLFFGHGVKSPSTVVWSSFASLNARDKVGSYLLFSMALTVWRETPHLFAARPVKGLALSFFPVLYCT